MRVLVSGGGREHATAWKTAQATGVEKAQAAAAFIAPRHFQRRRRVGRS